MHEFFFFGVYPYLCLTILGLGLLFRYLTTPGNGMRDRVIFCKKIACHRFIYLHYAIILTFLGHFSLLTPAWVMGALGVSYKAHLAVAGIFRQKFSRHVSLPAFYSSFAAPGCKGCMGQHCSNGSGCAVVHHVPVPYGRVPGLYGTFRTCLEVVGSAGARHFALFAGARGAGPKCRLYIKIHIVCGLGHFRVDTFQQAGSLLQHSACLVFARPAIVYRRRYENL